MSMSQSEIFLHLNLSDGWVDLACRADECAAEIEGGRLVAATDLDAITGLMITPSGKALLKPVLPAASA
jgi:hypothetical protein